MTFNMTALEAQLAGEEGKRFVPYDDATGLPLVSPQCNWGHFRCELWREV